MNEPLPPGLPPGAERIDSAHLLDRELRASRMAINTQALSLYEWSQIVNGLAVLEGAMFASNQRQTAHEAQQLQMRFLKDLDFGPLVREQMAKNRAFMELAPLPGPKK